jgi:insulysin
VPIIEALTKADITAFFNTYLSPASPRRAKLSVHMVAQKTAPAVAAAAVVPELTDAEKRERLRAALAEALAANGLAADEDKLVAHLAAVDLSSEQPPPFPDAAQAVESLGMRVAGAGGEAGGLQEALERAGPAVGKAWAQAWAQAWAAVRAGAKTVEEQEVVTVAVEPVWIEDGHAFRSRLEATCSVQPVRSVSDFEDTEPKL